MKNTLFRILSTEADATRAYDKYGNDTSNYITNEDAGDGEFIYAGKDGANHVYALIVGKDCTKFTPKAYSSSSYSYSSSSYSYTGSDELEHIFVTGGNTSYVSGNYYEALINSTTNTLELGCKNTIIPSFVTSIGAGAFANTGESITIPSSVTSIGDYALRHCSSLKSITIPSSVTSIGDGVFSDCKLLREIKIVNNPLFVVDCDMLIDQKNMKLLTYFGTRSNVAIPSSVTSIGNNAFEYCSLLESITIPSSVTSIGDYAFHDCNSLESITIPSSVTSIGNRAFWDCSSLKSITIPSSVTSIGNSAFRGCKSLTSITIPSSSSITSIRSSTFDGCSSLESIVLPSSITSIGDNAFEDCRSLKSITIPSSVTSIREWAFFGCYDLSTINFGGTVSDWGNVTLGRNWKSRAGIEVICSDGTVTL